tara:strand:- start:922 stop:1335 length:414 start_codon:yes stop_codon:yes gene_type:complete
MPISVYTDGSSKGNPGPGGWGVHINKNGEIYEFCGRDYDTTNNKMELKATIEALNFFKQPEKLDLYTDSAYVLNGITKWIKGWKKNGWKNSKKETVKNKELWKKLDFYNSKHDVNWIKVKAHSGDPGNERADHLATF